MWRPETPALVETTTGSISAGHVVIATQLPFADRGLFFAKAHPIKSYAIAARVREEQAPRGMYISIDQPTRSVRSTQGDDGRILIVGGESHRPGEERNSAARYAKLEAFLQDRFGLDKAEWKWSTHDYVPLDGLPYIGRLRRSDDRVLIATGYAKWGMTKGTLAAEILTDAILGRPHEDAALYDAQRRRTSPLGDRIREGERQNRPRLLPRPHPLDRRPSDHRRPQAR